jgi:hypothetical protein
MHAATGRTPFRFATINSLQRGCSGVNEHLKWLLGSSGVLLTTAKSIQELYVALEVEPDPTSNGVSYPRECCDRKGMELVLK